MPDWSTIYRMDSSRDADWSTRQRVASLRDTDWSTMHRMDSLRDADWSTRKRVESLRDVDWSSRQRVESLRDSDWSTMHRMDSLRDADSDKTLKLIYCTEKTAQNIPDRSIYGWLCATKPSVDMLQLHAVISIVVTLINIAVCRRSLGGDYQLHWPFGITSYIMINNMSVLHASWDNRSPVDVNKL